mgnify:CR=1 FL=1
MDKKFDQMNIQQTRKASSSVQDTSLMLQPTNSMAQTSSYNSQINSIPSINHQNSFAIEQTDHQLLHMNNTSSFIEPSKFLFESF